MQAPDGPSVRSRRIANSLRAALLFLALFSTLLAQGPSNAPTAPPQQRTVLTKEDLIRLSKEQVGDALIVEMIKGADELPNLTTMDVIELRKAGVSANVLTAVVQRRNTTVGTRPEITGQPRRRHIRVNAMLEPQKRSLFNRMQEKDAIDQIQVSWGFQAHAWDDRAPLDVKSSPNCAQESFCNKRDAESGKCLEEVEPGADAWKERFGCYADAKLTKFNAETMVFDVDLPEAASDARITAFFREGPDLVPWLTRNAENGDGERTPGQIRLQLFGSTDFDLELQIKLLMSPGGFVQDMQVTQCQVVNRDDAAMQRRIISQERQYCHVEAAR